jgi:glycosyltransferase involved in cell wall biosynthesis
MPTLPAHRPKVAGKFLFVSDEKFHIRGVTYGPFRPESDGSEYHTRAQVLRDFSLMAASGINTVRVYTIPPRWLLDVAAEQGMRVMVGLPWEQHVTFLDDRRRANDIVKRVREGVRTCANHPALLAYAVGNEIPAPIVRWHGHRKIERFIHRLYQAVKTEDSTALVTYVNYPSTEYLYLPFLDFVCFNVYLESPERLESYLARLQNIAGDRPLVMAEIGLDSLRNGEERQGAAMEWQIQTVFSAGGAGAFVFAWTDEWHRGGHDIDDWKFGLTTVDRKPKAALDVVKRAYADTPFPMDRSWPKVSVVVCTRNGARTIRDTLAGLGRLEYPNYETIVVDDGSTDDTALIARAYDVKLITTAPLGLSAARNTGLAAASGEIIAYLDDDAWPDEHWLMYLADAFAHTKHAGIGGPNIAPLGDGLVAESVSRSPGNPTHVLLTDRLAEHLPGCNMAFRTECLRAIGGFDRQFTIAGDDVDVCWRIQERGWTLGFTAGAMVWHHRRNGVRRFWRQQYNYGAAEGQLERKWPQQYTAGGHVAWTGRLYDQGLSWVFGHSRRRIYHGTWGSALFQSVYQASAGLWASLGLMPEWYLLIGALAATSLIGLLWRPLLLALPLLAVAMAVPIVQAIVAARRATFVESRESRGRLLAATLLTALLHLIQPLARLAGRMRHGMTPWRRRRGVTRFAWPWPRTFSVWYETWQSGEQRLESLEKQLRDKGVVVVRGGDYDRWDLELRGGVVGAARVRLAVEEHGSGKQMVRYRTWPKWTLRGWIVAGICAGAAAGAGADQLWTACAVLGALAVAMAARAVVECGAAMAAMRGTVNQ